MPKVPNNYRGKALLVWSIISGDTISAPDIEDLEKETPEEFYISNNLIVYYDEENEFCRFTYNENQDIYLSDNEDQNKFICRFIKTSD